MKCEQCGKEVVLPFTCTYCGKVFCDEHRLPESHECNKLPEDSKFWYRHKKLVNANTLQFGVCPNCGSQSSKMTGYDAITMTFQCKECGDKYVQSKAFPYGYIEPETAKAYPNGDTEPRDKIESSGKPKTRRRFPVGKVVGLILAVVIIGAFLWFSFPNFLRNNPFSPSNYSPSNYSHEELVNYTLFLINSDRNGFVTNPNGTIDEWVLPIGENYPQNVSLSSVYSAQQHADDMLKNNYFSHYDTQGYKPYMRYTLSGGNGSVDENIAWLSTSGSFDVKEGIESLEWQMMEEDSQWNWGHRDNIIDAFHNKVNIGIAYDSNNLYLVEDFEDDYIVWSNLSCSDNEMIMAGTIMQSGLSISNVAIYYDRIGNLTTQQLTNAPYSGSYDSGTFVAMAVPSGWKSPEGITITARTWSQTGQNFQIDFDLSPAFAQFDKGVYTLYLTTESNDFLTSFSIWN
ncbi:MAG: AN1-type zinc finger domain-containing protein [Candidatus Bathyarchaeia archaeon]